MKMIQKFAIALLFAFAFFSQINANDAELFSYDKGAVQSAVSELTTLENYVAQNPLLSVNELIKTGSLMVNGLMLSSSPFGMAGGEPPLGIPSFLWGCVFGVVGLLIVYIATDKDGVEVKKALWGCVTGTAVSILLYFVFWGAVFASASGA
jgi:hypothetical protein